MVYVIKVCWQLASRIWREQFRPDPARNSSDLILLASCQHTLYDIYHCCAYNEKTPDDGQRNCPKHVEFYSKNKFEKLVHIVGFIIRTHYHFVPPTRSIPQRSIFREYDWYIFKAGSIKCIPDAKFNSMSSLFYTTRRLHVGVRVLINWCKKYKYAWFGFIWNSDISARKWTIYSLMFRLFILRKSIHHYNQGLFYVPCRKHTYRTLNWKMDTCCQSGRIFISENTRTYPKNGNFTHNVVITNNNRL